MSKILITGGTGFVGRYLEDYLSEKHEVFVSSRSRNYRNAIQLDLLNPVQTGKILNHYKFDKIFHLTSQSSVKLSYKKPFDTLYDNINTTVTLLKTLHEAGSEAKVVLASTSEIYKPKAELLLETDPLEPRNPYAISKVVTDYLVSNLANEYKMNITLLRLFNHAGPGQADNFVLSSFAKQLAEIKLELKAPVLEVGNLDARRDFIDVRDVCVAYDLVSNYEEFGEIYNICSGQAHSIKDLLEMLIQIAKVQVEIREDPSRMRPSDVPYFCGSFKKIENQYGWKPNVPIETTLIDMFEWWVENLKN